MSSSEMSVLVHENRLVAVVMAILFDQPRFSLCPPVTPLSARVAQKRSALVGRRKEE